jgi:hypothetical protein
MTTVTGAQTPNEKMSALRAAWLTRRPVRVTLYEPRSVVPFIVGRVSAVAVTSAWVTIAGWHVPTDVVRSVYPPTARQVEDYAHLMRELREEVVE